MGKHKKFLEINHLDCTLRDGGYYNNWEFSNELTEQYLNTMSQLNIKFVELGFRSLKMNNFRGPNWYTSESYLNNLKIPENLELGVMINVSEVATSGRNYKYIINKLFKKKKNSKLFFVRVAAHLHEIEFAFKVSRYLKKLGYMTAINLMQASEVTNQDLQKIFSRNKFYFPDIFYLADSLGNMKKNFVTDKIKFIKTLWSGSIGIHTHNNLGLAIQNSNDALDAGANWVDSTVCGMGRGPGNASTEYLYIELQNRNINKNLSILPLLDLIENYFTDLIKKYKWGMNPFYYLSAIFNIHPTYIQEMISFKMDNFEMLNNINNLSFINSRKYISNFSYPNIKNKFSKDGEWSPKKIMMNKEVLFISSGDSIIEYKNELKNYILKKKPIVISLTTDLKLDLNLINYFISCNPIKLISKKNLLKIKKKKIITPLALIKNQYQNYQLKAKILDFGVELNNSTYIFRNKSASIPKLYNVSYALSVAASGKASRILLAGFDGYEADDIRNKIVDNLLYEFIQNKKAPKVISITPTNYSIKSISIYAL